MLILQLKDFGMSGSITADAIKLIYMCVSVIVVQIKFDGKMAVEYYLFMKSTYSD